MGEAIAWASDGVWTTTPEQKEPASVIDLLSFKAPRHDACNEDLFYIKRQAGRGTLEDTVLLYAKLT